MQQGFPLTLHRSPLFLFNSSNIFGNEGQQHLNSQVAVCEEMMAGEIKRGKMYDIFKMELITKAFDPK